MVFEHDYKNYPELTNSQLSEFGFSSPHKQITEDFTAEVVKVHDGDTVTLRTDFRDFDFPLRLAGVDSPEMNSGGEKARARALCAHRVGSSQCGRGEAAVHGHAEE